MPTRLDAVLAFRESPILAQVRRLLCAGAGMVARETRDLRGRGVEIRRRRRPPLIAGGSQHGSGVCPVCGEPLPSTGERTSLVRGQPAHLSCAPGDPDDAIRLKLTRGVLPRDIAGRVWGRPAREGETCDGCDGAISRGDLVMEGLTALTQPVQFHARCFALWDQERSSVLDGRQDRPPTAPVPRPIPPGLSRGTDLPHAADQRG